MGFSTSGAAAIMLIAFLVAAGAIFPTVFTASSETGDAFAAQADQSRDLANTEIAVTSAQQESDSTAGEHGNLTVTVANNGTNALDVQSTDLLADGEFIPQPNASVDTTVIVDEGETSEERRSDTAIWPPGTHLEFHVEGAVIQDETGGEQVDRVKVVTETGVADLVTEITEVSA